MTWPLMQLIAVTYFGGLLWIQRREWHLAHYVWGVFGFVFLFIHLITLQEWHTTIAGIEAQQIQSLFALFGTHLQIIDSNILLVPDATGWTGLNISIECSTVLEISVFAGLILFYPRLSMRQRWTYLLIGITGTYILNLIRISIIVLMIDVWGKPIVPVAHTFVGRLVYFIGVVGLYWYLLTKPTLHIIRRNIEATGRAVR